MKRHEIYYLAYQKKDAEFDGKFFVGVISTGIYCRPVCTAKMPRRENCRFFQTGIAAQRAGFRSCLRCRPDLIPGIAFSPVDISSYLAARAKHHIETSLLSDLTVEQLAEQLAERLGITSRHLRRIFTAEFRMSPLQFAQTCRLLFAKQLLMDTNLKMIDIVLKSGFHSLRRFNASFVKFYHATPSYFRHSMSSKRIMTC